MSIFQAGTRTFRLGTRRFQVGIWTFQVGTRTFQARICRFQVGTRTFRCGISTFRCKILCFRSESANNGFDFVVFCVSKKKYVDKYLLYIAKYAYKFRSRCAISDAGIFADFGFGILLLVLCVRGLTLKLSTNSRVI